MLSTSFFQSPSYNNSFRNLFKRLVGAYLQADRKLESTFIPFFDTIALQSESLHDAGKPDDASFPYAWESILFKYRSIETARKMVDSQISSSVGEMKTHRNCVQVINRGIVETVRYFSRSVEIDDVLRLFDGNMHCLVLLVHFASTSVDVLRLSIIPANTLSNYQARGITQVFISNQTKPNRFHIATTTNRAEKLKWNPIEMPD